MKITNELNPQQSPADKCLYPDQALYSVPTN